MVIETEPTCRIIVRGEIDVANCGELAAAIPEIGSAWLDFSGVTFLDSSCLRVLVLACMRAADAGHRVHVSGLNGSPLRVIEMTQLYDMLCRE